MYKITIELIDGGADDLDLIADPIFFQAKDTVTITGLTEADHHIQPGQPETLTLEAREVVVK